MSELRVEISDTPTEADRKALSRGMIAFNRAVVPELERIDVAVDFHVFVRIAQGEVRGGIRASCYWNTLQTELLCLDNEARGKGLGRIIMPRAWSAMRSPMSRRPAGRRSVSTRSRATP